MAMKLDSVVPFGRSLDEYVKMFDLSETDLQSRILGVGDGPASFNAEATAQGATVISVDPIYEFSGAEILLRFNQVVDDIIDQVRATPDDWVWTYHKSPDDLKANRIRAIETFLRDYDQGKQQHRYRVGALPSLEFGDRTFDISLCSHFLFLYSDHYDLQFHIDSIQDMLRISPDIRIFPLLTLMLKCSPHLDPVIQHFSQKGYQVTLRPVSYALQKGSTSMLQILAQS